MSRQSSADFQSASETLPPGWTRVALGNLGLGRTEGIEPAEEPDTLFELWSVPSFPSGQPERVLGSTIGSNKQRVAEGDVLLCKINPRINRVWRVGPASGLPQIASTEWIVFRSPAFDPAFLMWRFRENKFRAALCANMTGVGGSLTRARPKDVAEIEIALPPLPEQRRIVARLEALEARSRRARAKLAEVPAQLAQTRQSLLAAAFRGDLTADWRAQNRSALKLPDIEASRKRMWVASEAKRGRSQALAESRYSAPALLSAEVCASLPELPPEWQWTTIEAISLRLRYGTSAKSKKTGKVPVLRMGNLQQGEIDWDSLVYTDDATEIRDYTIPPSSVLFNRTNSPELVGKTAIYRGERPAVFAGYLICIEHVTGVAPELLNMFMQSAAARRWCWFAKSDGVSQSNISASTLAKMPYILAPLPEQHEIVRRLSAAFARLDAAASAHAAAVAALDRLDQSLLARAFSGDLVPQSAADAAIPAVASSRSALKPKSYLTQLVPALLRVRDHSLALDQINSALALLHSPRDARDRVFRELGALEALEYFNGWSQTHEDGALTAAINDLLKIGTLSQTTDRKGHITLHLVGKLPPISPEVEADTRHLATFIEHVPVLAPGVAPAAPDRLPASLPRARGQARLKTQIPI